MSERIYYGIVNASFDFNKRLPPGCNISLTTWIEFFMDLNRAEPTPRARQVRANQALDVKLGMAWDAAAKAFCSIKSTECDIEKIYNGCLALWYSLLPSGEGELISARFGQPFVACYSGVIATHGYTNDPDMIVHWEV